MTGTHRAVARRPGGPTALREARKSVPETWETDIQGRRQEETFHP